MAGPHTLRVVLNISTAELLRYYQGAAQQVAARARDGRRVHFPANILRQVVDHDGVHGEFELAFDEHHKFLSIRRVG